MVKQTARGKALEYAVGIGFEGAGFIMIKDRAYENAKKYEDVSLQYIGMIISIFIKNLENINNGNIKFMLDIVGKYGDSRDILIDYIGLSLKRNSLELKASRIGDSEDIGSSWFGLPKDDIWLNKVKKLFEPVREARKKKKEWKAISPRKYVERCVDLVKERFERGQVSSDLWFKYMLGSDYDYYLIMLKDNVKKKYVDIYGFNFLGTLNCSRVLIPKSVKLTIMKIAWNKLEISMGDWKFRLRLHTADKIANPSIKISLTLIKMPKGIFYKRLYL